MTATEQAPGGQGRTSRTVADVTLAGWFHGRARATPERRAILFEGECLTYGDLEERAARLASALREGGVAAGDRVAYLGFNQPSFFETLLAAARLGAILVPLNFRFTGPELAYVLGDADVHTLVVDDDHREVIDAIRDEVAVRRFLSADAASEGWEALRDVADASPPAAPPGGSDPDATAIIMYTSGTTGRPKGAMLTHANLWWNNVNALHTFDVAYDDVTLTAAPLFHIGGLNIVTLVTLQKGGAVVLHRHFDAGATLADVAAHGVTTMFAVPAMFQAVARHEDFAGADLSTLRFLVCGGAPLPEGLIRTFKDRGMDLLQGYGMTETAPMCAFLTPEYALTKVGSAGRPPLFCELRIVDEEGTEIAEPGVKGELCARGPNVMAGYWNAPEATREVLDEDGWLRTGDGGHRDEDGFFYVSDRMKDMVISGGENVYPAEVEEVLHDHPAVAEVAVIGTPDERWGELVTAVVAPAGERGAPSLEELREFAGERLARYKLPGRLEVVDALPRNPTGKVLKRELRERLAEEA